jgi:hypothetical protein
MSFGPGLVDINPMESLRSRQMSLFQLLHLYHLSQDD